MYKYFKVNPKNQTHKIVESIRSGREIFKETCKNRNGSIPTRSQIVRTSFLREQAKVIREEDSPSKAWIHPFKGTEKGVPITDIMIDGKTVTCTE